jgi:group I intron endonuclease
LLTLFLLFCIVNLQTQELDMPAIYQITNMLTGDFYIGSAQYFARREWQHRYALKRNEHKNPHMQASWNKYGEDAFVFEVLEEVGEDQDLLALENKYLHKHVGQHNCFNVNKDAFSPRLGQIMSAKSKAQLSENRKGKGAGKDHYRYGQELSPEVRAKISETQKGRLSPMKGKTMSEQGRVNVAAAVKRGEDCHFYGKRPAHADDLQKAIAVQYSDGRQETYPSLTYIRDTFGVSLMTTIRACKSGDRVERGAFAGAFMWYADGDKPAAADVAIPEEYIGLPRTRTEAKRIGAKKYFTGEACAHGHMSPRYTRGACVRCAAEESSNRNKLGRKSAQKMGVE